MGACERAAASCRIRERARLWVGSELKTKEMAGGCWLDRWRDWVDLKTRKGFWIGEDPIEEETFRLVAPREDP